MSKKEDLESAIKGIEKDFGKGSIMVFGKGVQNKSIEVISTGSLNLDQALGVGGYPKGRIIELYGPESAGKTTYALHAVAEVQKIGGYAAFIDAEHALDPLYATNLGVDMNKLILSQPDSGEQGLEITEALIRSEAVDLIVIDSVAALVPEAEIRGDMGASHLGLQARLMSQAMRKLAGVISKTNTIVIFINQIREKIGVMFGTPEVTPGGRALKFYATIRLDVRRGEKIEVGTDKLKAVIGFKTKITVKKNKVAAPFKTAISDLIFGKGICKIGEIIDCAVEHDIIKKSGSWFSYKDIKIGQGREKVKLYLNDNPEILKTVEKAIRKKMNT